MIYFDKEILQFPRHSALISNKLVLKNELTDEETVIEFVDLSEDYRYYLIDMSEVTLKDGTYRYQIGEEIGLFQVGDYVSVSTEYNENRQNIVYER